MANQMEHVPSPVLGYVMGKGNFGTVYSAPDLGDQWVYKVLPYVDKEEKVDCYPMVDCDIAADFMFGEMILANGGKEPILASSPEASSDPLVRQKYSLVYLPLRKGWRRRTLDRTYRSEFGDWTFDDRPSLKVALDLAEHLTSIHEKGFIHGDIKDHNILFFPHLGKHRFVDAGKTMPVWGVTYYPPANVSFTWNYLPPEHHLIGGDDPEEEPLVKKPFDQVSEIWGFGALLFQLFFHHLPYPFIPKTMEAEFKAYKEGSELQTMLGKMEEEYPKMPIQLAEAIRGCLQPKRNLRFTAHQVLETLLFPSSLPNSVSLDASVASKAYFIERDQAVHQGFYLSQQNAEHYLTQQRELTSHLNFVKEFLPRIYMHPLNIDCGYLVVVFKLMAVLPWVKLEQELGAWEPDPLAKSLLQKNKTAPTQTQTQDDPATAIQDPKVLWSFRFAICCNLISISTYSSYILDPIRGEMFAELGVPPCLYRAFAILLGEIIWRYRQHLWTPSALTFYLGCSKRTERVQPLYDLFEEKLEAFIHEKDGLSQLFKLSSWELYRALFPSPSG